MRAFEDNIAVCCISCIKAIAIGGKKNRYMVDLLFGKETEPQIKDIVEWHRQIYDFALHH